MGHLDRVPDRVATDVLRPDRRQPGRERRTGARRPERGQVGREHVGGQLLAQRQHRVAAANHLGRQGGHDRRLGLGRVGRDPGPGVDERGGQRLEVVLGVLVAQVGGAERAVGDRLERGPGRAGHRTGQQLGPRHQEVVTGRAGRGLGGPGAQRGDEGQHGHGHADRWVPAPAGGHAPADRPSWPVPGLDPRKDPRGSGSRGCENARWAPIATADMVLLPTGRRLGTANEGLVSRRIPCPAEARERCWGSRGRPRIGGRSRTSRSPLVCPVSAPAAERGSTSPEPPGLRGRIMARLSRRSEVPR